MGIDLETGKKCELTEPQVIILDIFKFVKNFLDQESIQYYMLGGTLLGAIRHKGFIPWDDDMDIGIERSKYEKFLNEVQDKLPLHLALRTYNDDSNHHYYFARIVDTRYQMRRNGSIEARNEEVWIDIFPLDGMPNNLFIRRIHMLRLLITRAKYHIACFERVNLLRPNRPFSERAVIKFVTVTGWGRNVDFKIILDKLDKLLKKYSVSETNWIVNFMGQYKFKEMFPKRYYGNGKLYEFEDMMLLGPEDAQSVLEQIYGEYMKVPKELNKNVHAAELITSK